MAGPVPARETLTEGASRKAAKTPRVLGKNVTPGQLALAWALAQGEDIVPIPGTKRRAYLDENLAALDITLSEDDLARIAGVAPKGVTAGDRYADMSTVNR